MGWLPWQRGALACAMAVGCAPRAEVGTTTPMQAEPESKAAAARKQPSQDNPHSSRPAASAAFVREATALRRTPSMARFAEGTQRKQANVLVTLQRGEALTVLDEGEGFLRVRLSDEKEGWVRAGAVRTGQRIAAATCLQPTLTFARPDFLAMEANRQIPAGSLLFVLRDKESFAEVDAGASGQATTWVLTDALERSGLEVEAAKLWQRAQAASARDAAAAAPLTELLRERFGATRLVRQLMQPVGEAPKAGVAEDGAAPPAPTDGDHLDAMGALLAPPVDAEP